MIKDQCNSCRKKGTSACLQKIVFDSTSCDQYLKKIDLSKSQESQVPSDSYKEVIDNCSNIDNSQNMEQTSVMSSLFSFKGRIRRTRYWLTNIIIGILFIPVNIEENISDGVAVFTLIIAIPAIWIMFATCIKRLHDLGKSGWYYILSFIPFINIVIGIYMAFFKGEEFDNKYGPNPY